MARSYLKAPISIGAKFGFLTVIEQLSSHNDNRWWLCQCECGKTTEITTGHLRGGVKSCGCKKYRIKHGRYRSPEYRVWGKMWRRCSNPNDEYYKNYGGRGITIALRWKDFANFYADMGPRPSPKHSIERINNNGGYFPTNCRWATREEQMANTRVNRLVKFRGEKKPYTVFAKEKGLSPSMIWRRIFMQGWPVEKALTTPSKRPSYKTSLK